MRALLFVVAGLVLAACTSSTPLLSVNPQAPNALDRIRRASETRLTLRFKNGTPDSILHMGAFVFECASAEPKKIELTDGQTATVVITTDAKQLCQNRDRFVYLDMYFRDDKNRFDGFLKVHADPPKYVWTGRLSPFARKLGLCTIPDGFEHGRQLHEGELIEFYLCR